MFYHKEQSNFPIESRRIAILYGIPCSPVLQPNVALVWGEKNCGPDIIRVYQVFLAALQFRTQYANYVNRVK